MWMLQKNNSHYQLKINIEITKFVIFLGSTVLSLLVLKKIGSQFDQILFATIFFDGKIESLLNFPTSNFEAKTFGVFELFFTH